jgi:hypothetical protein
MVIIGLLPQIHVSLTKQKVMLQVKVMEIVMRLEAMLGGGEILAGFTQVESQIINLSIKLQDMSKAKVVC